jgi:hypothetical protein
MRRAAAATALVVALAAPAATASGTTYPGRYLTTVGGTRVFASFLGGVKPARACPRDVLPLPQARLKASASAVARAMPAFYRLRRRPGRPHIDARDAVAKAVRADSPSALTAYRSVCGSRVWSRSAFVAVRLPHVTSSASLANPSFEVARTRLGWIIWAEVQ